MSSSNNYFMVVLTIFCMYSTLLLCCVSEESDEFLEGQNQARAEVGVGPLSWNETLASYALSYAKTRLQTCDLVHSGGPYGENLAMSSGDMQASEAVNLWLAEKLNYDYTSNSCVNGECLHYTQIIWRDTLNVGCARAKCNNDGTFVICSYYPPGNFIGQQPY